jgi:hypothetical protein
MAIAMEMTLDKLNSSLSADDDGHDDRDDDDDGDDRR